MFSMIEASRTRDRQKQPRKWIATYGTGPVKGSRLRNISVDLLYSFSFDRQNGAIPVSAVAILYSFETSPT